MALYLDGQKIISGGSGSGGHTIVDNEGVSLEQRTNLQFNGAYSEDNSTDDTTEVNVVREMTKAEFDLLSADEKVGIINVTDVTGGEEDKFQPVIYSEDEREIGVWTDGKPLYEKTIDLGALPDTSPNTVAHNINNLGIVVYASGTAYNSTSQVSLPIPYVSGGSSTYNIDINANSTNVTVTTYTDRSAFVGYIKLQYTKATDTAGSGQWTPQGVPAHHYSTDEQVVGTWVDGSTIYERVFDLGSDVSISNDALSDTTIDASNMNKIIYSVGQYSTGVTLYPLMANINNNIIRLQSDRNGNVGATVRYVILQYTKPST